ncbi:MAG: EF-P 5-aminopentanol modification-associated protein YfmF [Ruminiclostridium sp.]
MKEPLVRKKIGAGVSFSAITDNRYKLNKISVLFMCRLTERTAAVNALVPSLLSFCCNRFNTMAALNKKLAGMYSASLGCFARKAGDVQYVGLNIAAIDSRYAIDGEDIATEAAKLLCDCLFDPYLPDGLFPEKNAELEKQNQIDDNNADINNKSVYAYRKACAAAYKGEPAAINSLGENSDIEKITPKAALEAYRSMLETMNVEIICAGCGDFAYAEKIFSEAFGKIKRAGEQDLFSAPSKPRAEVQRITETLDVEQCKLVMVFKHDYENQPALMVMSMLYGGTESSKLFTVIREKMSLCYYCCSRTDEFKKAMTVECGIDTKNLEKTESGCIKLLEDIAKGDFTDEEIKNTKLYILNLLRAVYDNINSVSSWYLTGILKKEIISPEEMAERINAVTREEIAEAAASMKLDTVYVLAPEAKGEEE